MAEKSIIHYKQDGYLDINGLLGKLTIPKPITNSFIKKTIEKITSKQQAVFIEKTLTHIKNIDSLLSPGNDNKTYFRGFYGGKDKFNELLSKGGELYSYNYSSCTYDKNIARDFISNDSACCMVTFKIPNHIKRYSYEPLECTMNNLCQEKEVLLDRGISYRIIGKKDGIYIAVLDYITEIKKNEIKQITNEISKIKKSIDNKDDLMYMDDINTFFEDDYDSDTDLSDAYDEFELLYTIPAEKRNIVFQHFKKRFIQNQSGGKPKRKYKNLIKLRR
jgi:hypothetical protein